MQSAALKINERLSLEPLNRNYFEKLSALCDDNVAYQVQLPALKTPYAWQLWFDDQTQQGHSHYVIYEQSHGVLGAAGFEHCQLCDLFYFWLGRSVRCQGVGTKVATYLQQTLSTRKTIYALTFANNMASSRAFQKAGWYPISLLVNLFDTPVSVFSHKKTTRKMAHVELAQCFIDLKSDLVLNVS